ncbi:SGNH/GDSL hydrolase family protein [Chroococcus sp. FPU101]|uniref:SGNH/GDSL hydrolase family protein n=1 Tax=Chroococcus sp. FPU101 TaxID=1974212 RepID=UPI001A9011F3|nr:SGNH/GDSL hydrolase family protein [Chroococcus sp. FPU101]GFE69991.1 GDSL family lipase [Chroococcus sp. FPU101]
MRKVTKQLGWIFGAILGQLLLNNLPVQAVSLNRVDQISQLFVFGDSLVDDGNLYELTGGQFPSSEDGYYQGRFSNGRVFVEDLPDDLRINGYGRSTLTYNSDNNYAIAGAGTTYNYFLENDLGLDHQINHFLSGQFPVSAQALNQTVSTPSVDENALYLIAAGANDYLPYDNQCNFSYDENEAGAVINIVTQNLAQSVTQLSNAGARNFAVTGLADLSIAPEYAGCSQEKREFLKNISLQHNLILEAALQVLEEQQGIDVTFLDLNNILQRSIQNFSNTHDACMAHPQECTNPDQYLFWDEVHLTAQAHTILAQQAVESYRERNGQEASIPEPDLILGLFVVVGLGKFLKR